MVPPPSWFSLIVSSRLSTRCESRSGESSLPSPLSHACEPTFIRPHGQTSSPLAVRGTKQRHDIKSGENRAALCNKRWACWDTHRLFVVFLLFCLLFSPSPMMHCFLFVLLVFCCTWCSASASVSSENIWEAAPQLFSRHHDYITSQFIVWLIDILAAIKTRLTLKTPKKKMSVRTTHWN